MDFWKSDPENAHANSVLAGMQEFVDSPAISNNSLEDSSDSNENCVNTSKPKLLSKSILLAKKRLQAYSIINLKAKEAKETKPVNTVNETAPKHSVRKEQKTVYPDEVAKAVIRDIEVLKKSGFGFEAKIPSDIQIPDDPVVSLAQVTSDSPSVSVKSDQDNVFLKREIKCRNIRKNVPFRPRSVSPQISPETADSASIKYPKNWTEYKEMNLNVERDSVLKLKVFKKFKDRKFNFKSYFNFETPSVPIENFTVKLKSGFTRTVPYSHLRCTAAKPQILYSTNQKSQPGYLTRQQLFAQIPREKMLTIEKLGEFSRCQPFENALTSRKWYPKTWKNVDSSEVKLVENSIGLSFLQNYSDDEDVGLVESEPLNIEQTNPKTPSLAETSPISAKPPLVSKDSESLNENQTPLPRNVVVKKSKWDDIETVVVNASSNDRTPPLGDKEEGEVLSDEEEKCDIAREYEKTKEELEKLEATLKTSTVSLENIIVKKSSQRSSDKNGKKKKHRRDHRIESSKRSKKKSTRKSDSGSYMNSSSESLDSEDESSKRKNKKKKSSKRKHQKSKSRRIKKKKLRNRANRDRSQSEDFDVESDLEDRLPNKLRSKNKLKESLKMRLEHSCEISGVKDSDASDQENYDDDIKFFAARFDAETKLKGKSKKKAAPIIALEDLSVPHSKLDERVSKRKSIESDSVVSPAANVKKNEETDKEDAVAIKVDLLKLNEDYLREQKKKEEEKVCIPSAESAIDSEGKMLPNADFSVIEEIHIDKEQTEKSFKECTAIENNFDRLCREEEFVGACVQQASGDQQATGENQQANGEDQQADAGEQSVDVPNTKLQNTATKPKIVEPDWNVLKNKRKLLKSDEGGNLNVKPLNNSFNDSFKSSIELLAPAVTFPLLDIVKKEAEENELSVQKSNSWQTIIDFQSTKSRSLNLEMPLNIKPFLRRDMKIEKDFWDIEEAPTRRSYENSKKTHKNRESELLGSTDKTVVLTSTTKKGSDNTIPDPIPIKLEKSDEVIDVELNNSNNCITLENEYEEFLKAVTSTKKPTASETFMIDCSSTKCVKPRIPIDADNFCIEEYPVQTSVKIGASLEDLLFTPVSDAAPAQIPLPQIQPVPAPSPNIEAVIDIHKSLINLSVPANVTQNITLSLATSAPSISAPSSSSSIDTSKSNFQISTPLSLHSLPLPLSATASSSSIDAVSVTTPEIMTFEDDENKCNGGEKKIEKLTFTALTLPSKKLLMGKSKLNLDDSDSEDLNMVDTIKRKKLESLIENNKKEITNQSPGKSPEQTAEAEVSKYVSKDDKPRRDSREKISPKRHRRDSSPSIRHNRSSSVKRRDSSPRRRTFSPRRKSPKRRSPTLKRKLSSRRSMSPKRRRRTPSPRRRRSPLLKGRSSPRRHRSTTPKNRRGSISKENRPVKRPKSPLPFREMSPPKRSVADSTISDEQLQQDNDYCHSGKGGKTDSYSPRRRSLDDRINEVLGMPPAERGAHQDLSDASYYNKSTDQYHFDDQNPQFDQQYSNIQSQVSAVNRRSGNTAGRMLQSTYKQVGNMLQIVPTENLIDIPMPYNMDQQPCLAMANYPTCSKQVQPNVQATPHAMKSKYLQVGNMLQIVPTEMVSCHPVAESASEKEIKPDVTIENGCFEKIESEKSSAESSMMQKVAERRAEKENRRQERDRRRKEKERRKKAKEKVRQARLKVKTENMIRRALELEGQDENNMEFELASKLVQWPPIPNVAAYCLSKEAGKSILMNNKTRHLKEKKVKLVQFADGIRPGEGTSPSGGEELSSPPPPDKQLPKEKRFRKLKFGKPSAKKKVKVKIIRKLPSPLDDSESDDNLLPPSPPPGSPPPHIFPPRIKTSTVNNVPPPFLASIMHTAQHQQQQQPQQQAQFQSNMYRPPLNMLLTHPPNLQGHLPSHGAVVSAGLSPQGHYHPGLGGPPPPPPQSHSSGHNRHY
ncbi:uncharacterized protein LOC109541342 isoform X1 [Dendroctonus ponderosae]|uniref:uncharacterized protein LOC109541342 isoform X1 n=1 Tax=Dendroctonus ponderosae TaxID=77166 RepID=UPI00203562AB|nr:uncharacterized protein LOC109541342 isoform X1 [Dendroctonus ponderosae]